MLYNKLGYEERRYLFRELFGYELSIIAIGSKIERIVLYNERGEEFYSRSENLEYKFVTLFDFFEYAVSKAKEEGYVECRQDIRKVLGGI